MESQHSEHTQANQDNQVHEYCETEEQHKGTLWKTGMAYNRKKTDQEYIWETGHNLGNCLDDLPKPPNSAAQDHMIEWESLTLNL